SCCSFHSNCCSTSTRLRQPVWVGCRPGCWAAWYCGPGGRDPILGGEASVMKQRMILLLAIMLVFGLSGCGGPEEQKAKYRLRAQEYVQQGNFPKARVAIQNVLKIDPKDVEAYFLYAQVEERERNWRNALSAYQQVVELDPDHDRAQVKVAKFYLEATALEQVPRL